MFSRKIILFFLFSVFANADTVNVTADNFFADENKLISILTGNVVLKKGDYDTLKADKLTIYFDKEKNPIKYVATGNTSFNAILKDKHYDGKGEILTYEPEKEIYTLEKNAYLHEKETKKEVFGDKIIVDRAKTTYEVKSISKKPIKLIFEIEDKEKK